MPYACAPGASHDTWPVALLYSPRNEKVGFSAALERNRVHKSIFGQSGHSCVCGDSFSHILHFTWSRTDLHGRIYVRSFSHHYHRSMGNHPKLQSCLYGVGPGCSNMKSCKYCVGWTEEMWDEERKAGQTTCINAKIAERMGNRVPPPLMSQREMTLRHKAVTVAIFCPRPTARQVGWRHPGTSHCHVTAWPWTRPGWSGVALPWLPFEVLSCHHVAALLSTRPGSSVDGLPGRTIMGVSCHHMATCPLMGPVHSSRCKEQMFSVTSA